MKMVIEDLEPFPELKISDINNFVDQEKVSSRIKNKLKKIQDKYKDRFYTGLLYRIINISFETEEAKKLWFEIL